MEDRGRRTVDGRQSRNTTQIFIEHPEFAVKIPQNAQIVLQVEGDEEYNRWSRELAERQKEPEQPAVFIKVKGLKPAKSRLIKPEVALA